MRIGSTSMYTKIFSSNFDLWNNMILLLCEPKIFNVLLVRIQSEPKARKSVLLALFLNGNLKKE